MLNVIALCGPSEIGGDLVRRVVEEDHRDNVVAGAVYVNVVKGELVRKASLLHYQTLDGTKVFEVHPLIHLFGHKPRKTSIQRCRSDTLYAFLCK